MSAVQPVNVRVDKITKAHKDGFAVVDAMFDGSEKVYTYIRKFGRDNFGRMFVIISGCRVTFDADYTLISVTREYDTKGQYRGSTEKLSKRLRRRVREQQPDLLPGMPDDEEDDKDKLPFPYPDESEEKQEEEKVHEQEPVPEPEKEEPVIPKGKIKHPKYNQIMSCIDVGIPVYLAGPAGSGKNHTVEQIAKELGWEFYFSNSIQQEYKLTGFIDAGGRYHETEFYKACTSEEECVFFLDEIDASIPDVLVLLNAAIANGYFEFPNGRVDFDNVHFVAAGNTVGSGADDMYTGRMVLDSATLDRFAIIEFDYDNTVELKLTKGNTDLIDFIHDLRKVVKSRHIRHTVSYRCEIMVTKLEKAGMPTEDIMRIAVLKGLDQDTINSISMFGSSKYYRALSNIQTR